VFTFFLRFSKVNYHHARKERKMKRKMKRTIRKNVYGNWVGFVGRKKVEHFGDKETLARYWLATGHADVPLLAWLID
jgi:hypothetical protein